MFRNDGRKSIGQRTIITIVIFTLLLTVAATLPVSYGFSVLSKRHFIEDTRDYASIAAHSIDGDRINAYAETGVKDEYYKNTETFLKSLIEEVELTEITVFVPHEADIQYIWDVDQSGNRYELGELEIYSDDGMKNTVSEAFNKKAPKEPVLIDTPEDGSLLCIFAPVFDEQGEPAAVLRVSRHTLQSGMIISQFFIAILASSAFVSVIAMLFVYRLIKKHFIRPISILTKSAETMVSNLERKEAVNIDIHTNDELETLAEAFTKMDVDLREYIGELSAVTAERERISGELDAAAKIQKGILPKLGMQYDKLEEFDLAASMIPAREVGGDFYDIFMADDKRLALVIADVSGKGVPASLFMVATKILLKYSIKQGLSPSEAFSTTNEKLIESNDMELFVTAWLALIDLETGECVEVNAGHEHPALRKKDGLYELIRYRHSPALATLDEITFRERTFRLDPGDSLFVYTDGVTEATNSDEELFGNERLVSALNENSGAAPEELLKNVKDSIDGFVGNARQFDDITMLAFRYNGK